MVSPARRDAWTDRTEAMNKDGSTPRFIAGFCARPSCRTPYVVVVIDPVTNPIRFCSRRCKQRNHERVKEQRVNGCQGKARFPDSQTGRQTALWAYKRFGARQHPYECECRGDWHLGTNKPDPGTG
jgi:hypothetical protein